MKQKFLIGIDVGGTKIAAAAILPNGKILSRAKTSTPPKSKPTAILKVIFEIIEQVLREEQLSRKNIRAIGIGIPGIVNKHNHILATPNINLANFPLCAKINKKYRVKVTAGNDVNLGLLGEHWLGVGKKSQNIVGVFPGTGVGGAIIIDGKILIGTQGAAAELGHMSMQQDGPLCSCGNFGCLEAYTGRWAIERDIRQHIKQGRKTILTTLTDGKLSPIKSRFLKAGLKAKDPLTVEIMTKTARTLGQACINLRHILNPELIILGGGVIEACDEFLMPIINKTFHADPFFAKIDKCKIVASTLGDDAVILGAAALAKNSK
ncbi:MAG: ROK family protein [Candidatus Omnitrophica bacterium]|nr:ROK family protein [Candidatus Omnitrophota bacterium]